MFCLISEICMHLKANNARNLNVTEFLSGQAVFKLWTKQSKYQKAIQKKNKTKQNKTKQNKTKQNKINKKHFE